MIEVEEKTYGFYICYCIKGTSKLHREDGPAVIYDDGLLEWWLNGKYYDKEEWLEALPEDKRLKALYSDYFIGG
jgi:hypothetical protein